MDGYSYRVTTESDETRVRDMAAALDYWPSPPLWGWRADDLDLLPPEGPNGEPGFFENVELLSGVLVFEAPESLFHERAIQGIASRLGAQSPDHCTVAVRMHVKLGHRTRPRPDVLVAGSVPDGGRTFYRPEEVLLAVEVMSPESEPRDRGWKPSCYAAGGIRHLWRVEEKDGRPVVYVYELDPATRTYASTGIHRGKLGVPVPFGIGIDLDQLVR
jgi:Uma2 family endonuclease